MFTSACRVLLCRLAVILSLLLAFTLAARAGDAAAPAKEGAAPAKAAAPVNVPSTEERVANLESRTEILNKETQQSRASTTVWFMFLFAAFCALWAQNSNRNPWLWFFLGFFFTFITVFVLLWKNSRDRKGRTAPARAPEVPAEHEPVGV